jgi:hypothetical protein
MTIVNISEEFQPSKYLVITLNTTEGVNTSANVLVSDLRTNRINLVNIQQGPQGIKGETGTQGPPGKDGLVFDVLPISSGGTSNSVFNSGYLISYDGSKLSSSPYTIEDIISLSSLNTNAITGLIPGTGLQKTELANNNLILDVKVGDGLTVTNNTIIVDDTIPRKSELGFGDIQGTLPISKGGTNNSLYTTNRLIYFDGNQFTSFPISTGQFLLSGTKITIEAGSGLIGGGDLSIPSGSVLLEIGGSSDILVEENSISLSETGIPGIYSKIQTDSKGRVISGSNLTTLDIINILGYTPWHSGNDGSGSGLDADLLDGKDENFYRDITNITGVIPSSRLSNIHDSNKEGLKFRINTKGLIEDVLTVEPQDVIEGLGFKPLNSEASDLMNGFLTISSGLSVAGGKVDIYDNLPLFGTNNPNLLPSDPRGFIFRYGGQLANRTGIFAYYPADNQLKLITNVFSSSENTDLDPNNPSFQDDINGGNADTIFITQSLGGNQLTVLFREIADNIYINTNQFQQINVLKEFLKGINVLGQIKFLSDGTTPSQPVFDVGNNSIKVINLNADLLDDQDGSFYRNASNITGSFSYNNVSFDHISGINNYIPKFNGTNKINNSNIKQRNDENIEIETNLIIGNSSSLIDTNYSLAVGNSNKILNNATNSLAVGFNNSILGNNSFAAGSNNIASGSNSVAINNRSIARGATSVAMGSNGLSYLENQQSFGAFATFDNNQEMLEQGQYSTVAAYLRGTETNNAWFNLSPTISLPQNKSIAFNVELLINKGLSSGVANFIFNSGIINNASYRDPNNFTNVINRTFLVNTGIKTEIFNNSQLRRHRHEITYKDLTPNTLSTETKKTQFIWAQHNPAQNPDLDFRYFNKYYFYKPEQVRITGTYIKNQTGSLILDIDRPRYYANFSQNGFSNSFFIDSTSKHDVIPGSLIDVHYSSGSIFYPPSGRYRVNSFSSDGFSVNGFSWTATKYTSDFGTKFLIKQPSDFDQAFVFELSGSISNNTINLSSIINNFNYSLDSFSLKDKTIKIIKSINNINYTYNRIITGVNFSANNKQLLINSSIKNITPPYENLFGDIKVIIDNFSAHLFKTCDRLLINNEVINVNNQKQEIFPKFNNSSSNIVNDGGSGTLSNPQPAQLTNPQNSSFLYENDDYNNPSFSISVNVPVSNLFDGEIISIAPLFNNNTGSVNFYSKNNFNCKYTSSLSSFNANTGVYIRYIKNDKQEIKIFDTSYNEIDFISAPVSFSFVDGPFSENNDLFKIINSGNRYFLYSNTELDYNITPVLPIRIKATPSNTIFASSFEKILFVLVEPLANKPPQSSQILDPIKTEINIEFVYSLPNNFFIDPDNNIVSYSAYLKNSNLLPGWLSFDSDTLSFSGTPNKCDIGVYNIEIKAIDSEGLFITNDLIIEVYENVFSTLENFAIDVSDILKIQDITLSNRSVKEYSSNSLIGEISYIGGYNPYVIFNNGFNSSSGIFIKNSNMFRYAFPNFRNFPGIINISGAPPLFGIGAKVTAFSKPFPWSNTEPINIGDSTRVTNVFSPTVISGTPINSNKIYFDDTNTHWNRFAIFTGQNISEFQLTENFGIDLRAKKITSDSIIISNNLMQESRGLILTEDNFSLEHKQNNPKRNEDSYKAVAWSVSTNHKFYDEYEQYHISDECNNTLISNHLSSHTKYIEYPKQKLDILIMSENNDKLIDENKLEGFKGIIYDERIWHSEKPIKIKKAFRNNINYNIVEKSLNINLNLINKPGFSDLLQESDHRLFSENNDKLSISPFQHLSISNIDYERSSENSIPKDTWLFNEPINNAVLYFNNLGNDNVCKLVSDDRSYSGYFYQEDPLEYAILTTEDSTPLVPETEIYNGSRIKFSSRYEIIESSGVGSENSFLVSENIFEKLLCENEDFIVDDHIIYSQRGEAYILFPGINNYISITYPESFSYSRECISEKIQQEYPLIGYYDDSLILRPEVLSFKESDFYYTWGKMIPYRFSTDEYAIRLSEKYTGPTQSGTLLYSGISPQDGYYFPEKTLFSSKTVLSGNCPDSIETFYRNGIEVHSNNPGTNYVTGTVTFYTSYAANNISVESLGLDINKDLRINDYVYLYNPFSNNSNALLPSVANYSEILSASPKSINVRNFFLFPSSKNISHTGTISLNLDRNHGQVIKNTDIVNNIPIKFNSVFNNGNAIRIPKNNLFKIENISGQKIFVTDNKNYMLLPDKYFDRTISGNYLTNGVSFFGSLFHNNSTIYDIRTSSTGLIPFYQNILFEYNFLSKKLNINVPSGIVNAFDNIKLSNFQPLFPYMQWDYSKTYQTGFKIFPEDISIVKTDKFPDRAYILLEKSTADLQPEGFVRLTFSTNIFPNSSSGTCNLDVNLSNRIEKGYLLNYADNTHNSSGHQYIDFISGYSFSGFIPKYNNVISNNSIINDNRIGFSSVFNTGSSSMINGLKSLRLAQQNDIGFTEFYHIGSSGFINNQLRPYTGIIGVGSENRWYISNSINTSGNNKLLEFLYLGHNTNNIKIFGSLKTATTNEFKITKITLSEQLQIEKFKELGQSTGVNPIITTGTNSISKNFDISIPVQRFDYILLDLSSSNNTNNVSEIIFNAYAEQPANPPALMLDVSSNINTSLNFYPSYKNYYKNLFYILPSFNTNTKYCNINKTYNKNNRIYYNGNLMLLNNFSSINSYALYNDQIKIETLNNKPIPSSGYAKYIQKINDFQSPNSIFGQNLTITGISIDGEKSIPSGSYAYLYNSLKENLSRNVLTFGTDNSYLSNTGKISFTYNYSGSFDALTYNNIYTQMYGGYTSRWPQDFDAVLTEPPITGTYQIIPKNNICSSGKLCILINGYLNSSLNSVSTSKQYFFDFDEYAKDLSASYFVFDRLSSSSISISTPYLEQYEGLSGIVMIIPSKYNIKTHLNPNSNNSFIIEKPAYFNQPRIKNQINYFDNDTKKWTNLHHISDTLPAYSGYPITLNNTTAYILYDNKNPISITNIREVDSSNSLKNISNNNITLFKSDFLTSTKILISTSGGSPLFSGNLNADFPKVFISGLSSYNTILSETTSIYNYIQNSGWNVGVQIFPLNKTGEYPLSLIVKDETGQSTQHLTLTIKDVPKISQSYPAYSTSNNGTWISFFDLVGISSFDLLSQNLFLSIENSPTDDNYQISYPSASTIRLVGSFSSIPVPTGNWNPIITIKDSTNNVVATTTGFLFISDSLNERPEYLPTINKLQDHYFINLTNYEKISFEIPVFQDDQFLNIYFNENFESSKSYVFDTDINKYIYTISPTDIENTKYIKNAQLSFDVDQTKFINGSPQIIRYSSSIYTFDITLYKPLILNQQYNTFINNVFTMDQQWFYEFEILEGAIKHRPDIPPRIKLINTPSYGNNNNINLSYRTIIKYKEDTKSWIISIIGLKDQYDRFAPKPGVYNVQFFVDDYYASSVSGSFNIVYSLAKKIDYIQSNIYTTPNNEFFINADVIDNASGNKASNSIIFNGENSLSVNLSNYKFNQNFNTWEYYATGNKLLDKWDARIIFNTSSSPSLTLQCKGIATDKITAVAKVNLLELQNIGVLDTLPIKITGIKGGSDPPRLNWSQQSGLVVEQGYPWLMEFKTVFGLASPEHPPTIILSGTPSLCSGYYPNLDPVYNKNLPINTDLDKCITKPFFNPGDKSWNFKFSGDPSCTLLGPADFSIFAIDTNLQEESSIYIEPPDTFDSIFTYIPISAPHPPPQIKQADKELLSLDIEPFCESYYNEYSFGPRNRVICPAPTGLSGYSFSGSVPSGLSFRVEYFDPRNPERPFPAGPFNAPIYDNFASGKLIIEGIAKEYPSGGSNNYSQKLYFTVFDARNNSTTEEITFSTITSPFEPNIYTKIYFQNRFPVFTPFTGTRPLQGNIRPLQPEASSLEINCLSLLPESLNKNCTKFTVLYSGSPDQPSNIVKLISILNNSLYNQKFNTLVNNAFLYFNPLDSNVINNTGNYFVRIGGSNRPDYILNNDKYLSLNNVVPASYTGLAEVVVRKEASNIREMGKFPTLFKGTMTTEGCLLGNGRLVVHEQNHGLGGFISPSYSGFVPSNKIFSNSDTHTTGLSYIDIGSASFDKYAEIKYTSCLETGFLRISGIILPPLYIEATDPVSFTDASTSVLINSRLSYGESASDRSLTANRRSGTAQYFITNLINNIIIQSGSISVGPELSQQAIGIPGSLMDSSAQNKGAVYELLLRSQGGTFPTYFSSTLPNAIPSNYYWIHRLGFNNTRPEFKDMPPIIISQPKIINLVSGEIIKEEEGIRGFAVGGYIPLAINGILPDGVKEENYALNSGSDWSTSSYIPIISGIIIKNLQNNIINSGSAYFINNSKKIIVKNDNELSLNNSILLTTKTQQNVLDSFYINLTQSNFENLPFIPSFSSGTNPFVIDISNFDSNILSKYPNFNTNIFIEWKFINKVIEKDNNYIIIKHNNLPIAINDNLVIDKIDSKISTCLYNLDSPLTQLTIDYINSNEIKIVANGGIDPNLIFNNIENNDFVDIYLQIEDNIKTMPQRINWRTEGFWSFDISGRANILDNKPHIYRILTKENSAMPIFRVSGWVPKSYFSDIPMKINKPIKVKNFSKNWISGSSSWTVNIVLEEGFRPALSEYIDIQIDFNDDNWTYCGFNRYPLGQDKDLYVIADDTTIISLASASHSNIWSNKNFFRIKISDSTGFDIININRE